MASIIDVSKLFETQRTVVCMGLVLQLHNIPDSAPGSMGQVLGLCNHWTAGDDNDLYDSYSFNVARDRAAGRACIAKTLDLNQKGQGLWGRNSSFINNTLCAMATKDHQPEKVNLDALALLNAEQCFAWGLDPRGTVQAPKMKRVKTATSDTLVRVPGVVVAPIISDHAFWARQDGYYPDRWDIGVHITYVRNEATRIYDELKSGKRKPVLTSLLKR